MQPTISDMSGMKLNREEQVHNCIHVKLMIHKSMLMLMLTCRQRDMLPLCPRIECSYQKLHALKQVLCYQSKIAPGSSACIHSPLTGSRVQGTKLCLAVNQRSGFGMMLPA